MNRLGVGLALVAVYIIWGTTYLGIRFALESFPPFILNGMRFLAAGLILLVIARLKGQAWPTWRQWRFAAGTGILMMVGGVGLVSMAENLGVGSGVTATAVAVIPVWTALIAGFLGEWPTRREWIGLAVGLAGVVILIGEGDFRATIVGTALVLISPIFWSAGSVWSTKADLPGGATMATAAQLLSASVALLVIGPLRGERIIGTPTASSWLAMVYLTLLGSVVAYTAYVYLLRTVRPALATSYAYVNPVVAVFAGVTLGAEVLTGPVFVAMPLILGGVALVTTARRSKRSLPEPLPEYRSAEEAA